MTTQILIEFDPKDASPLDVVNALNKLMLEKMENQEVEDYALLIRNEVDTEDLVFTVLVATEPKATTETP